MTQPFSKTAAEKSPGGLNLDIDGWLRRIGLAQYAEMFHANDIDIELLGRLTNDDLRTSALCRSAIARSCWKAIAELAGAFPVSPQPRLNPRRAMLPSAAKSQWCFLTLLVQRRSLRAWTRRTARSHFGYQKCVAEPWVASAGSWRNTWETAYSCILAIRRPMRTTPSALCARARVGPRCHCAQVVCSAPSPRRHRDRPSGGRGPDRLGRGAGARHCRRDAEPRCPLQRRGRAQHGCYRRRDPKTTRQFCSSLRTLGQKTSRVSRGRCEAWAALRQASLGSRFEALTQVPDGPHWREEELELLLRRWSKAKPAKVR